MGMLGLGYHIMGIEPSAANPVCWALPKEESHQSPTARCSKFE